jgi:hypothetical protein
MVEKGRDRRNPESQLTFTVGNKIRIRNRKVIKTKHKTTLLFLLI